MTTRATTAKAIFASPTREPAMATAVPSAVPSRFNRYGEPIFERIRQPARGAERCEECGRTGLAWQWIDIASGEQLDEPGHAGFTADGTPVADGCTEDGAPIPGGARLEVKPCDSCDGKGWYPPAPRRPAAKPCPVPGWLACDECDRRGGTWYQLDGPPYTTWWWGWSPCDMCSPDPDAPMAECDGLGWIPDPDVVPDETYREVLVEVAAQLEATARAAGQLYVCPGRDGAECRRTITHVLNRNEHGQPTCGEHAVALGWPAT